MAETPMVSEGAAFVDLESFLAWLTRSRERMTQVIAEVEQVQATLNGRWGRCTQRAEEMAQAASAMLLELGEAAPDWAVQWVQAHLAKELETATSTRETLKARAAELQAAMQTAQAEAAAERQKLATDNPALDAREEELKATRARQEAAAEEVRQELEHAAAGVGWLLRAGRVRELRHSLGRREAGLKATEARLQEVRLAWQKEATEGSEAEASLMEQWRAQATALAQVRADLAPLEASLEEAARLACLRGLVDSLQAARETGNEACDRALAAVLEARAERAEVEECLRKGAEVLGLLKGLVTSVERFQETVRSMRQEEEMHAELSQLRLQAPAEGAQFGESVEALLAVVQDETAATRDPEVLTDQLGELLGSRLAEAQIERTFTALGECLKQAADAQWA